MKRAVLRDTVYIGHMLEAIQRARRHLGRKGRAGFLRSELLQDAVMRNVEIIGEAAGRVSPQFAAKHAAIPWRDIVGMRHRLIHGYVDVDLDTVWDVVARDLPALETSLRALVEPTKPAGRKRRAKARR